MDFLSVWVDIDNDWAIHLSIISVGILQPFYIYPSICLSIHKNHSIHLSRQMQIHLLIYLCIYQSIYLSIYRSIYLSINLSIYLSMYLSIQSHTDFQSLLTVHTKSVSRPRGCRRRNTKTRKRENPKTAKTAETPSTKTGRNENAKTAKTRKRQKRENAQSRKAVFAESKKTLQSIIALAIKDARRWEKHKKTETRKLETGKKCSRFLVVWFCTEAVHSAALGTRRLSQLWAYVKYVPKQSIP